MVEAIPEPPSPQPLTPHFALTTLDSKHTPDRLPVELEDLLRSLGGCSAPAELWDRVSLSLLGEETAPEELWERVEPTIADLARPARPLLQFRRLAAAAAVLLVLGFVFLRGGSEQPSGRLETASLAAHEALRDYYLGKVVAVRVSPSELSPSARALAGGFGAPLEGSWRN